MQKLDDPAASARARADLAAAGAWPISWALFLYQGGYPKLDKDFAGYPPTPPENSILIKTLAVAT
jgi:hypothetical protein